MLVVHVSSDVPREVLGPTAEAGASTSGAWLGDAVSWRTRCPARLCVALVQVPVSGASGIFTRNAADQDVSTAAVAAAAAFLPEYLGVHAVIPLAPNSIS